MSVSDVRNLLLNARTLVLAVTVQTSSAGCRPGVSGPSTLAILSNSGRLDCDAARENGKNEVGEHGHVSYLGQGL